MFNRAPDGSLMLVPVSGGASIKVGQPRKLFDWGIGWAPFYDISPDGNRGIAAMPVTHTARLPGLSVVQNWHLQFRR